ncbi:phytanoyl-CoA dioxygenase family protein [Dinghuibacter silviterrae]|uniref:Phytanoyl-CoA dioxygenase PhyH n=1 Tax=Dinghuibacter silviterrae TaxID=1539049 RepID=A0A4R8DPG5_9BACT|nr:phytanoyl-CoA dioxygenase family protein [Dinghuibacter silviterrae]TDW99748.1 phytanoyl-CoA dioxygenase PhyH [Dinghuibacter silviterrae]
MSLEQLRTKGYTILDDIYTPAEIRALGDILSQADSSKPTFRRTNDLFAIRQFLKEIQEAHHLIFNEPLMAVVRRYFGEDYFVVKSIYFDKPEQSNWFVAWHQDLTISVDKKVELPGFGPWTVKQDQFAVQPPLQILENIFTVRIHLDPTDEHNGALRVIPGSHLKGIQRFSPELNREENICRVPGGGVMLMRPLLLHASHRTTNAKRRRVIHIEFCNVHLPKGIKWAESTALYF